MFSTHQGRIPNELALQGLRTMEEANRYLHQHYRPEFNQEFAQPAREEGTAFIQYVGPSINEILCEHYDRTVGHDNCVSFENRTLQIPPDQYRCNYVKTTVRVHRYRDGTMAIFHGPRKLAQYDSQGSQNVLPEPKKSA